MDGNMIMMTVAAILILISAILYFVATFFGNAKKQSSSNKDNSNNQNELVAELKKQNVLIQSRMENLEREIRLLSGKQENQVKSIIKYNKENARQLALSERDTLMRVMNELKKAIGNNAGAVVVKEASEAAPVMKEEADADLFAVPGLSAEKKEPVTEEPSLEALVTMEKAEEPSLEDLVATETPEQELMPVMEESPNELEDAMMSVPSLEDLVTTEKAEEPSVEDPFVTEIPEVSDEIDLSPLFTGTAEEEAETPEFSDELDLSSLFAEMEKEGTPVLAAEEPVQAAAPAADPLAGFGSDPNAMMTPEDIAKLLEAMGQ